MLRVRVCGVGAVHRTVARLFPPRPRTVTMALSSPSTSRGPSTLPAVVAGGGGGGGGFPWSRRAVARPRHRGGGRHGLLPSGWLCAAAAPLSTARGPAESHPRDGDVARTDPGAAPPAQGLHSPSSGVPVADKDAADHGWGVTEDGQQLVDPVSDVSSSTVWLAFAGNSAITVLKAAVWLRSGSSAMLAETLHTLVDTANQAFLILGLKQSRSAPDLSHQYGYGRAAFFWGLVSALGLFWCGAGVSIFHGTLCGGG